MVTPPARGINNAGQIVGYFDDGNYGHPQHGFLLDTDGSFTTLDPPGSVFTWALGVNNAGQIVGTFNDSIGQHGFLYSGGSFSTIDVPAAFGTSAFGINDAGQIVGQVWDSAGRRQLFLATPAQSPGLARLLGKRSSNAPNVLMGGSHVFTSPAKTDR